MSWLSALVLGSAELARCLKQKVRINAREQAAVLKMQRHLKREGIVAALEQAKRQTWGQFSELN